jgi:protein-tyrosine phosphatase
MINDFHNPEKLANFRDLGATRLAEGKIKRGKLFRSDDLANIDLDEAQRVAAYGVGLIIDLRSASEAAASGRGPLGDFEIDYLNIPLMSEAAAPHKLFEHKTQGGISCEQMGYWYHALLETASGTLVHALEHIASAEKPVVFHCVAGKDRTGLLAMVILDILGASQQDSINDYMLTQQVMPSILKRMEFSQSDYSREDFAKAGAMLTAQPESAQRFFDILNSSHQSITGILQTAGLSVETIQLLRRKYSD